MTEAERLVAILRLLPEQLYKSWRSGIRWQRMRWHVWRKHRHEAAIAHLGRLALADKAEMDAQAPLLRDLGIRP